MTLDRLVELAPSLADIPTQSLQRLMIEGTCAVSKRVALAHTIRLGQYRDHLRRQSDDIRTFMADESLELNPAIDYDLVPNLSMEVRSRLKTVRPLSIVRECFWS